MSQLSGASTPNSSLLTPHCPSGKGDRFAVDEVPTRAPNFVVSLSIALDSRITANLSLALTRGAGESTVSVGSRCPRLESVRRGKPLQPTPRCREAAGIRLHGGDGLRPAGDWEGAHSPAVGHGFSPRGAALRPSPCRRRLKRARS